MGNLVSIHQFTGGDTEIHPLGACYCDLVGKLICAFTLGRTLCFGVSNIPWGVPRWKSRNSAVAQSLHLRNTTYSNIKCGSRCTSSLICRKFIVYDSPVNRSDCLSQKSSHITGNPRSSCSPTPCPSALSFSHGSDNPSAK